MVEFFVFLLKSIAVVSFILGGVAFLLAVVGRLGKILTLRGRARAGTAIFGVLLMSLAAVVYVVSYGERPAGGEIPVNVSPQDTGEVPACVGRERPDTPCWWTVEANDSFERIATATYGDRQYLVTLVGLNRDDDGYRRSLHSGDRIFLPDLSNIPLPPYPTCVQIDTGTAVLPCLYEAEQGETYRIVASRLYRLEGSAGCIRLANFAYDGVKLTLLGESLDADLGGYTIVMPVPRPGCAEAPG